MTDIDVWTHVQGSRSKTKSPTGGTWKDHWVEHTEKPWPDHCTILDCEKTATDGGHVKSASYPDTEFIVPVCGDCNKDHEKNFHLKSPEYVDPNLI
jgi:hypothetical protein